MFKRLTAVVWLPLVFALVSCDLLSLKIYVLDDYVLWDPVDGAAYYVYIDGQKGEAQNDTFFMLDKTADVSFRVDAVKNGSTVNSSKEYTRAADPEPIRIHDTDTFRMYCELVATAGGGYEYFLDRPAYSFEYTAELPEGRFVVSSAVKRIAITTGGREVKLSFVMDDRSDGLIFELNDAVIRGVDDSPVVTADGIARAGLPNVIFRLTGKNELYGGNNTLVGADGRSAGSETDGAETAPTAVAGEKGGDGGDGCPAVDSPITLFYGDGSVVLTGSAGASGGNGGDSKGVEGGYGGDGGNGGNALSGLLLFVNTCSGGTVRLSGGAGGAGGKQGNGFANMGHTGQRGKAGRGFAGKRILVNGTLEG